MKVRRWRRGPTSSYFMNSIGRRLRSFVDRTLSNNVGKRWKMVHLRSNIIFCLHYDKRGSSSDESCQSIDTSLEEFQFVNRVSPPVSSDRGGWVFLSWLPSTRKLSFTLDLQCLATVLQLIVVLGAIVVRSLIGGYLAAFVRASLSTTVRPAIAVRDRDFGARGI